MIKLKVPLMCAISALLLSFFIGLISGVRFSAIIIRSILISILSGAFVFGARMLLDYFIPDLFQNSADTEDSIKSDLGKSVNISIDDPIDLNEDSQESEMTPKEVNQKKQEYNVLETDNKTEIKEEETNIDTTNLKPNIQKEGSKKIVEELEELPDLQDFLPQDEEEETNENPAFMQTGTSAFDVSTDLTGSGMDANTMVQAIRTVLKRDS